jgi:RyR domain
MEILNIEQIARVCHEANRAYCASIGDNSQKPWLEVEQWQRDSAIQGVRYALANPAAPASAQHDAWLADKERDGWKFGPVKDPEKKEHPCFVPYEQLPAEQKIKDYLFMAVVTAFVQAASQVHKSQG